MKATDRLTVALAALLTGKPTERAEIISAARAVLDQHATMLAALTEALPYVESAESDPAYKRGAVARVSANMRKAITDV